MPRFLVIKKNEEDMQYFTYKSKCVRLFDFTLFRYINKTERSLFLFHR